MASKSDPKTYTKPELRDKVKEKVTKSDKGGRPGQWSARKAQLVTQEYEKEGGGYKKPRNESQQSLKQWGDEHWQTADGSKAQQGGTTKRYLPKKAWDQLSPEEKKKTDRKKIEGSQKGHQFVANTPAAAEARKKAAKKTPAKSAASSAKKTGPKKAAKAATKTHTKRATKSASKPMARRPVEGARAKRATSKRVASKQG